MKVALEVKRWSIKIALYLFFIAFFVTVFNVVFGEPEYKLLSRHVSPDGSFMADVSWAAWGGWGYSYCFEKVTVHQANDQWRLGNPDEIYKGSCYGRGPSDKDFVSWLNDKTLQVTVYVERLEGDGYYFSSSSIPDGLKATLKLELE